MRRIIWATCFALLAGLPTAIAVPASGWVSFSPPGSLQGNLTGTADGPAFLAAYATSGPVNASARLEGTALQLSLIESRREYVFAGDDQICVPPCTVAEEGRTLVPLGRGRAAVEFRAPLENLTLIFGSQEPLAVKFGAAQIHAPLLDAQLSSVRANSSSLEPFRPSRIGWPNNFQVKANGTNHHVRPTDFESSYRGPFFFLISGGTVRITNETGTHEVRTGSRWERAPDDPSGASQNRVRIHHTTLIGSGTGSAHLAYSGPYAHILSPRFSVAQVSSMSIPLATLRLQANDATYRYDNRSYLDLEGLFDAAFGDASSARDSKITARIEGDVARIQENRIAAKEFREASVAVPVATGLGLLVVVYFVVSWFRRGTTYAAGKFLLVKWITWPPLAARLTQDTVLDHPARRQLLDLLQTRTPYTRLSQLRREAAHALGIPAFTVYYHLRKLHAAHLINVVQRGRTGAIFVAPNHQLVVSHATKVALALLQTRVGRAVADALVTHEGATQKQLIETVQATLRQGNHPEGRISSVAVHKWIRKFESFDATLAPRTWSKPAGTGDELASPRGPIRLVERKRRGRRVHYWPTRALKEALERLRSHAPAAASSWGPDPVPGFETTGD